MSIGVDVDINGDVPITMLNTVPVAVSTPTPFDVGPLTLNGIPDTFHFYVEKLPKIQIGMDPLSLSVDKLPKIQVGMDPLTLNIAVKEIPSVRTHIPADYKLGVSILGLDLLCFRLCGEAQVITEPYRPNPCERCGPEATRPNTPTTHTATPGFVATPAQAYPSTSVAYATPARLDENP